MRIDEIDVNLKVNSAEPASDTVYADVRSDPFDLYGLYRPKTEPRFCRLPVSVSEEASKLTGSGIVGLTYNTAGGRVRFSTDSPYISIRCRRPSVVFMPHMAISGSGGFDLCETKGGRDRQIGTFLPPTYRPDGSMLVFNAPTDGGYSSTIDTGGGRMRSYTIHFPLYNDVDSLEIGLQRGSHIAHGAPYRPVPPVVFYGSSITQGGCASKPGNAYSNLISASQNVDHLNLGFSGSALGEPPMARYIASLPMSVFVCDYDYNAPSADYLNDTHEPFFRIIREQRPDLPILIVSRCSRFAEEDGFRRREILYRTYRNALNAGDKNVYFLDGTRFFDDGNDGVYTVEGCHPNDAGFVRMAEMIGTALEKILADLP